MKYAKALAPLAVGLLVGLVLIFSGDKDTGRTVLLAVIASSGITAAVPNKTTRKASR